MRVSRRASGREREERGYVVLVSRVVEVVGGSRSAPDLFRGFTIVEAPWNPMRGECRVDLGAVRT